LENCVWLDLWNGPHAGEAAAALDAARQGKVGKFSGFANTAKGNRRYWDVQIAPIFDGERVKALLSVSRDVTEKVEIQARQEEALQEMRHRAKNALTIVQAIASQTLKAGGEQLNPISRTFTQRLQALGRSYDALVLRDWAAANLRDLLSNTLLPFDEGNSRIIRDGPDIVLGATDAMALGLAINELATNAAKYGSLSNDTGRVIVEWRVEGEPSRLRLQWREEGGPRVEQPTRRGFGSALIDRALPGELGGTVKISYNPEGVVCEIDVALKDPATL
jgi:two-component sensor histidine kinase